MSTFMYSEAAGTLADLHKKLGGENGSDVLEGLKKFLRGENPFQVHIIPVPGKATWEVQGDLIYITLPASEGVTGQQWIDRFEAQGKQVSPDAKKALQSADFQPTPVGFVHRLVALKATFWKKDSVRTTKAIQAKGVSEKWLETHPEAVCIVRECFSDEELEKMGLWWLVGVHKTIVVDGDPRWLGALRYDVGRWLGTRWADLDDEWDAYGAFFWSLLQENQS